MSSERCSTIIYPSKDLCAHISSFQEYQSLYIKSIEDPQQFWSDVAKKMSIGRNQQKVFLMLISILEKDLYSLNSWMEVSPMFAIMYWTDI